MNTDRYLLDPKLRYTSNSIPENKKLKIGDKQLIVLMGLQGAGKSVVAQYLEKKLNGIHFDADKIRQEFYADADEATKYSDEAKAKIDLTMYSRAIAQAKKGTALIDATFWSEDRRRNLVNLLEEAEYRGSFKVIYIFIDADDDVAKERIEERLKKEGNLSTSTFEHRQNNAKRYAPLDMEHIYLLNNFRGDDSIEKLHREIDKIIL